MSDAPIPTTEEQEAPPPAPRLLLVDDEPGLRTAVQAYLEDEGFDVTTAVDGEEGFTKAQQMLPDVVWTVWYRPVALRVGDILLFISSLKQWRARDLNHNLNVII